MEKQHVDLQEHDHPQRLPRRERGRAHNSNQKPIVVLSLATKSSYKGKRSSEFVSRTDWHRVIAFGRLAESARTLTKGAYVEVEGQLQSREYVSGETKRRASEVRARSITKLEHTPRGRRKPRCRAGSGRGARIGHLSSSKEAHP
jgi:single-strand DNA-binding protein